MRPEEVLFRKRRHAKRRERREIKARKNGYRECPICDEQARLEGHHLIPKAHKKIPDNVEVRRSYRVYLCHDCHTLAHMVWGPGNDYRGPMIEAVFMEDLRIERRKGA